VRDPDGATGTATVTVVVSAAAGARSQGDVAGASSSVRVPSSLAAFRRNGVRVTVACARGGSGRATLRVSRTAATRLGLARRTVAARSVRCKAGREVAVRLKPSRRTARRLAAARTLKVTLRVAVKGTQTVQRSITIRPRR
jgi:hypothetical protein